MDLLDRLSPDRHDTAAIADAATRFADLPNSEQEEYLGLWDFAGLAEAEHPFTALLCESHNSTCVVRSLDGSLELLWEDTRSGTWFHGPLCRENLIGDGQLIEDFPDDPVWLDAGVSVSRDELLAALAALPPAPGPVLTF